MNRRSFYYISILLGLVGFLLAAGYQGEIGKYSKLRAASIDVAITTHTQVIRDPQTAELAQNAHMLAILAMLICGMALVTLVIAAFQKEPGWYLIALVLIVFDVIELMLLA